MVFIPEAVFETMSRPDCACSEADLADSEARLLLCATSVKDEDNSVMADAAWVA